MRSKAKYEFVLAVLCLALLAAQTSQHYDFFPAGNFPNAYETVPLGVGLGHIVGYYLASGANNAYIQTGTSFADAAPPGSITSYLTGINRHGIAVGGYCPKGCNPVTGQLGYRYDSGTGKMRTISFPMNGASTTAYGINDSDVIVGGYCPNSPVCPQGQSNPASHGFIDTGGVFTTLDFPGAQATSAFSINNAGTIVGFYIINNTGPHAFLYQNGTFTNIDFPGSGDTVATAVNNSGVAAGLFGNSTGVHGFTYSNGTFTQIDKPGATATQVTGINDRNEVVGYWYPTIGFENFKAIPVASPAQP
jgi:probable HAF family extracellular repeat protein